MLLPTTPDEAFALTCTDYRHLGLSLEIRCACGRTVVAPFRATLIARPALARVQLGDIVPRIRCESCGGRPIGVAIIDAARAAACAANRDGPKRWEVVLIER